jgi:poly(A) polymerase
MDWLIRVLGVARSVKDSVSDLTSIEPTDELAAASVRTSSPAGIGDAPAEGSASWIAIESMGPIATKNEPRDAKPTGQQACEPSTTQDDKVAKEPKETNAIEDLPAVSKDGPRYRKHNFSPRKLDRDAVDVVRRLRRHDYAAYLVGGCVRDLYLGLSPKDFDVSTSAKPEEIKKVFRNSRIIGRRFRLAHIYFRGGKIIETATFRGTASNVGQDDASSKDLLITRDNVWGSEKEDALRRDFTINGLMYDISNRRIIDYVGGLEDLDAQRIRTIGNADIRLREDPVRILRAIRFAAKLDFKIDDELTQAMLSHGSEIERCAKARVLEETLKLFRSGSGAKCVEILMSTRVLRTVLPQLVPYVQGPSNEDSDSHDEVFGYLRALDELVRKRGQVSDAVILTALLMVPIQRALDELEPRLHGTQLNAIILGLTKEMELTRRIRERTRQMLLAQNHLRKSQTSKRPRRRVNPKAMIKRSYFADALNLFEIWSKHHNTQFDQVQVWRARAGEWDSDETQAMIKDSDADEPTPRRKRRRRGRSSGRRKTNQGEAPGDKKD